MKTVYLAGPITGLTYDGATDWRAYAKARLAKFGIQAVSPMRAKEFLKALPSMPSGDQAKTIECHGLGIPHGFVARDRLDVRRADAILMNLLDAKIVSIGTMAELGWADAFHKPVILAIESEGNIHEHGFVRELTQYHNTSLDIAIETVAAILQD